MRAFYRSSGAVVAALLCVSLLAGGLPPRALAQDPFDTLVQHDFDFAARQLNGTLAAISSTSSYPSTTKPDGSWNTTGASDWTSGFFPGSLWLMYERTGDTAWKTAATQRQAGIEGQKTSTSNHDVGFKIFTSFGNAYRLTGNDTYRQIVLTGASSLAKRYDPDVGCIRSWGSITDQTNFEVIIDNMMNLELLFWAAKHGGRPEWYAMAVSHATRTMQEHVRADGSTYQIVTYNPSTGAVKSKSTKQGYSSDSTWSRGQAWAVYGFTTAYRYTKDPRFLDAARRTADYFVRHLPPDRVPYWDFDVPDKATAPRDTSAAAVTASALLELSGYEPDPAAEQRDIDTARDILTSLSSPTYAPRDPRFAAMLQHGTQHLPKGWADSGIMFGDYYFVEALGRYEKEVGSTAAFMSD